MDSQGASCWVGDGLVIKKKCLIHKDTYKNVYLKRRGDWWRSVKSNAENSVSFVNDQFSQLLREWDVLELELLFNDKNDGQANTI